MISLADFTTEWRNHSHSNLHFLDSMTDEEEFAARSQLKWTREGDAWILLYRRRRMAAWSRHGPPWHVAISQSRRHPKQHF